MTALNRFTAIIMVGLAAFNGETAFSDIIPPSRDLKFTIASIGENGLLVSTEEKRYRIYAIILDDRFLDYALAHIIGNDLYCDDAGHTGTHKMFMAEDTVAAIDCSAMNSVIGRSSSSLQEELIKAGVAIEYCQDSRNRFRTCHAMDE